MAGNPAYWRRRPRRRGYPEPEQHVRRDARHRGRISLSSDRRLQGLVPITPALAFDVDYRYFATTGTDFTSTNPDSIKSNYGTHNLVASLTWLFGVPTAP